MRVATAMLVLLGLPQALTAQAGSTDTGLLLGMKDCDALECRRFSTVWIVRTDDRVRVVARGRGLLVPRAEGFWWVGIAGFDDVRADAPAASDSIPCDSIPEGSADEPADVDARTIDVDESSEVLWAERAGVGFASPDVSPYAASYDWLDWVGTDWIASGQRTVDYREHQDFGSDIAPFASYVRGAVGPPPSGDGTEREWRQAVDACAEPIASSAPDEMALAADWTVRRGSTHWKVLRVFRMFGYDEVGSCEVPPDMTTTIIGHDRVSVAWSAIKDVLPGATTAFQSPAGDLLVVQDHEGWYAFLPRDGRLGAAVAKFDIPGVPMMAQWAAGPLVADWTRDVSPLLAGGPPTHGR